MEHPDLTSQEVSMEHDDIPSGEASMGHPNFPLVPPSSSPPRSNSPFSPDPPRARRTDACQSSEDSEHRPFEVSNVKYRVGAPPLRPLPLTTMYQRPLANVQPPFEDALAIQQDLIDAAHEILQRRGILRPWAGLESVDRLLRPVPSTDMIDSNWDDEPSDDRVSVVTRVVPEYPEVSEPTLLIIASWDSGSAQLWETAVMEIKAAVNKRMLSTNRPEFDMTVEMLAPELVAAKYVGVVTGEPLLEAAWPTLGQRILHEIEALHGSNHPLSNLSLLRLGYNRDPALNPITVYIAMDYTSKESCWPPIIAAIETYLHEAGWGHLLVHMEHNEIHQSAFELNIPDVPSINSPGDRTRYIIKEEYKQRVDLGADIGASNYLRRHDDDKVCNPLLGTLGCYVEVETMTSTPGWMTMALTCHHVVRPCSDGFVVKMSSKPPYSSIIGNPLPNSTLEKFDASGRFPNSSDADNGMEHPTHVKHNETVTHLRRKVAQGFPWAQSELDQKLAFFDEGRQMLGHVWASSGYSRRTPDGGRLDWALIQVSPDRQGTNALPRAEEWESKYVELPESSPRNFPNPRTFRKMLKPQGDITLKMTSADNSIRVFKVGAISGVTCGTFCRIKSNAKTREDKYMFAHGGGRGTEKASFVGMKPHQSEQPLTYVTPIEDVFEDIKKFSRGKILNIRVA
ncbi:hypothetical protein N3K66_005906 [Trichothecium roseum]|uniref:Uncharacterized protein n=1 Tax=Trichothecium roseum TaxID=47278 RepID=A0ACC0V101_9HYPO|nr:hypothetical protein N3K66_005906 [Trichothecium roseum]